MRSLSSGLSPGQGGRGDVAFSETGGVLAVGAVVHFEVVLGVEGWGDGGRLGVKLVLIVGVGVRGIGRGKGLAAVMVFNSSLAGLRPVLRLHFYDTMSRRSNW